MDTLTLVTNWFFSTASLVYNNIFTTWGFVGSFLFSAILLRKLVSIFRKTF